MVEKNELLSGKICPYCGRKTELIDSGEIYHGHSYGWMYICRPCDAYVGCHTGTTNSLGRLANVELRAYKQVAHNVFDLIWKDHHMERSEAYSWLSRQLGVDRDYTHMGMFDVEQCKLVIECSKKYLLQLNEPHYSKLLEQKEEYEVMKDKDTKNKFKDLLLSTHREGMEIVIEKLEELGFFKAPASAKFHLNYDGGLLEHSLNVCNVALELRELMIRRSKGLSDSLPIESVIIAALLHDVCKADIYKPAIKKQKNPSGVWCDVEGYDVDYSNFPLGHGEKSVIILIKNGLMLTNEEIVAIRWHMSPWDLPFQSSEMKGNMNAARECYPLLALIQAADVLAANILE